MPENSRGEEEKRNTKPKQSPSKKTPKQQNTDNVSSWVGLAIASSEYQQSPFPQKNTFLCSLVPFYNTQYSFGQRQEGKSPAS